jgi:hypothetical protein
MEIIDCILEAIIAFLSSNDEEWNVGRIILVFGVLVAIAVFGYLLYR